ncbi:DUF4886 domain-containing protein [Dysgonomonas termitidis]|uniref:DUF4886 domain-containing protein n=1 Tax=Dysgonomonas termitidis TaxID=1516126 RepID=A0ABV9L3W5_9BACT
MQRKIFLLSIALFIYISSIVASNDTIRVLAIGNSFSEDAVENYLYDLGKADGVTFIIGNMLIGGCSLEKHWNNAENDLAVYSYRKIEADGIKTVTPGAQLSQIIPSEPWDYISFQQVSPNSGVYDTYFPYLLNLYDYVKARVINPDTKYMLHLTWAYAQNTVNKGFANYNNDQYQMYTAIVEAVNQAAKAVNINIIIPSGTAIQNARSSGLGDTLCRDGHHLSLITGRYIAACAWYEKLTGHSVVGNSFAPTSLSESEISIAQKAADDAILHPDTVTIRTE